MGDKFVVGDKSGLVVDWSPEQTVPHPDPQWREFGSRTLARMRRHALRCAPWQHEEIWFWAASTDVGRRWLEGEIEYWHQRMNERDKQIAKHLRRRPILEPGDDVEYENDYEEDLPFTEQLRRREKRDWIADRFRP